MNSIVIMTAYKPSQILINLAEELNLSNTAVIVVDDGSGEKYRDIFDSLSYNCIVLNHTENRGKGAAIKTALKYINDELWEYDTIGIMDSDGQHLVFEMERLLQYAQLERDVIVTGARDVHCMPFKSRIGNVITRDVFQKVSGVNIGRAKFFL